ncbi:hypothetical protein [Candidatus Symbiopectobacterium sp. NZEC135]|uniref:hypothetical protein n=1 Tax=Candidatus Symbiopectobacterium sp. NZEC135 TaxID=2820471 RepID=UPI002225E69F|nr:hypothetical protein [Candidatus Symbiopectobacterium sp. NZEC135]MCW2479735.1 hypothetical protein [Candidatus Symbiopectobacterium sp. NZEC135]
MKTTRVAFLLASTLSVAGCADHDRTIGRSCSVNYMINTFPDRGLVRLEADKIRFDRFGRMDVRVKKQQMVRFVGSGWLKHGEYSDVSCGDENVRNKAI